MDTQSKELISTSQSWDGAELPGLPLSVPHPEMEC